MSALQDQLATDHVAWARVVAWQTTSSLPSWTDRDDLEGAALEGLVSAASRWDSDRGVGFRTFAYRRVRGSVYDQLRRIDNYYRYNTGRVMHLVPIPDDLDDELDSRQIEDPTATRALERVEDRDHLRQLNALRLSHRDRLMVTFRIFYGFTYQQIADVFGLTESRICQVMGEVPWRRAS